MNAHDVIYTTIPCSSAFASASLHMTLLVEDRCSDQGWEDFAVMPPRNLQFLTRCGRLTSSRRRKSAASESARYAILFLHPIAATFWCARVDQYTRSGCACDERATDTECILTDAGCLQRRKEEADRTRRMLAVHGGEGGILHPHQESKQEVTAGA